MLLQPLADSCDTLISHPYFWFGCQWLRISISTSQPPCLLPAWSNFHENQLLSIWTSLQMHTWMFKHSSPQKCWESALFSCTLGKVKASPLEGQWIWTGFKKKKKTQVYQDISELFISSFAGNFFFSAFVVNELSDGIQTNVWDKAVSSVWLIALCNNDRPLSKYSLLKLIVSAVQI